MADPNRFTRRIDRYLKMLPSSTSPGMRPEDVDLDLPAIRSETSPPEGHETWEDVPPGALQKPYTDAELAHIALSP